MTCSAFHCVYLGYVGSSTLSKYTVGVGNGRHYCPLVFTVTPIRSKASVHLMFSFSALGSFLLGFMRNVRKFSI